MDAFDQSRRNRCVIEDFTSNVLASMSGNFARLVYVASLRNVSDGTYSHFGLEETYSAVSVQQALAACHEELLIRILETPLEVQERDLRIYVTSLNRNLGEAAQTWQEHEDYLDLAPDEVPAYLRDLFCSNLRALLGWIAAGETSEKSV